MKVIGFNFSKISAEKLKKNTDKINIKTEIDVSEIKEIKKGIINTKDDILEVSFKYDVKYEPDFANILINGEILVTLESKLAKEVLKKWKKKQMPEEFRVFLFNVILRKAALKALYSEEELNLPLHIPMPSVKKSGEK